MAASGIALAAVAAFGGYSAGRSGHGRIAVLEQRVKRLERNASANESERNRLRAERDRLETRLAAQNATPKACPSETLSTSDAHLIVNFAVDYPCAWNVLEDPLQKPSEAERAGLQLDQLFFSALPISKAPRRDRSPRSRSTRGATTRTRRATRSRRSTCGSRRRKAGSLR